MMMKWNVFSSKKKSAQNQAETPSRRSPVPSAEDLLAAEVPDNMSFDVLSKDMMIRSERRAWHVTYGAIGVCVLALVVIALMMPLKRTVPYLVRVDSATGDVDLVQTLSVGKTTYGDVVDKKNIADYINYREGYDWFTARKTYAETLMMSDPAVASEYQQNFNYDTLYGNKMRSDIDILSISLDKDTAHSTSIATVRFRKTIRQEASIGVTVRSSSIWVATLGYHYSPVTTMTESERRVNPLGFMVRTYHADAETPLTALPPAQKAAQPAVQPQPATLPTVPAPAQALAPANVKGGVK
jgi:type IV secretion system protein VirB8